MTSGETPTGPSATKLGGYALIGVGALAAVFGVATLASGESEDVAAPPPSSVAPPVAPPPEKPVEPPVAPPPVAQPPVAQPPVAQPPVAQPPVGDVGKPAPHSPQDRPPPNGADQGKGTQKTIVRIYNNSTVKGLAHRAADDFRGVGYDVPEVGNYSAGRIYTTTVYFRPGTPEQAQAEAIATHFGARVEPRFDGIQDATPGLIAIITNDYKGPSAAK